MLHIVIYKVCKTKKTKPIENSVFDGIKFYEKLAKNVIGKNTFGSQRAFMLRDEDSISYIMHRLMQADWRYIEKPQGKNEVPFSRIQYLLKCGKWAIYNYNEMIKTKQNTSYINLEEDVFEVEYDNQIDVLQTKMIDAGLAEDEIYLLTQVTINEISIKKIKESTGLDEKTILEKVNSAKEKMKKYYEE